VWLRVRTSLIYRSPCGKRHKNFRDQNYEPTLVWCNISSDSCLSDRSAYFLTLDMWFEIYSSVIYCWNWRNVSNGKELSGFATAHKGYISYSSLQNKAFCVLHLIAYNNLLCNKRPLLCPVLILVNDKKVFMCLTTSMTTCNVRMCSVTLISWSCIYRTSVIKILITYSYMWVRLQNREVYTTWSYRTKWHLGQFDGIWVVVVMVVVVVVVVIM
jgi:hypothetical protein